MSHAYRSMFHAFAISAGVWCAAACRPALAPPATNVGRADAPTEVPRFDRIVSKDIFAGLRGDDEAMARGLARCEQALARNPIDPQPLMWHGLAIGALGGKAYRHGDPERGRILVDEGSRETEQAVALAPDDVWVLVYYALEHSA